MKIINPSIFDKQSFTDSEILYMDVDFLDRKIEIKLNNGWFEGNNQIVHFSNAKILINSWSDLDILIEDIDFQEFKKSHPLVNEILGSICEFEYGKETILRGYGEGKNGYWTEWHFMNSTVTVTIE